MPHEVALIHLSSIDRSFTVTLWGELIFAYPELVLLYEEDKSSLRHPECRS